MSNRIRILLTASGLLSTTSPYREMVALARYLPRERFDITFCGLRDNISEDFAAELKALQRPYMIARFRQRGFKAGHIRSMLRDQRKIEAAGPFDIQHSMDFSTLPIEPLLARRAGRIFIHFQKYTLQTVTSKLMLRVRLGLAHAVHTLSDRTYEDVKGLGTPDPKIHKIYNGIDLASMPMDYTGQGDYILIVGQVIHLKGHHDAIQAFGKIAPDFPNLKLRIAGALHDEAYLHRLKAMAQDSGISERVEFLGMRKDIADLLRDARLFMLCSEADALPWSIIEAQTVGVPVIVSNVEGAAEIVVDGKTGYTVNPGDIEGYAKRMRQMLNQPEQAQAMALAGRQRIEATYSAPAMVDGIAAMYEAVYRKYRG